MWRIPKLIIIAYEKMLQINTITKFLLFRMNMLLLGAVYLIIDTYGIYYYFIIRVSEWTYSFLYCIFVPSNIYKEYREY